MRQSMAFIDDRALARNFKAGDIVQKNGSRDLVSAPYYGRVLFSNAETGIVTVQWPWGAEQETPSYLNRVLNADKEENPILDLNQWYSNWDSARHGIYGDEPGAEYSAMSSKIAAEYERKTMPMWRAACKLMHHDADEFEAFKSMSAEFSGEFGSDAIRRTVANLYGEARRLAVYWHDSKRRYRVTKKEKASGVATCPRCKTVMKPRTFRQNQKVLQCRMCGFSIHPADLLSDRPKANKSTED